MPTFYSPTGNPEVWESCPAGYTTAEDWLAAIPRPSGPDTTALFASLRAERDSRIASTDYLLMPDYPLDDESRSTLITYRQALRDLPAQEGAPWDGGGEDTPWPELPSVLVATSAAATQPAAGTTNESPNEYAPPSV